jgi:PAP2 superfamily protein
VTALLLLNVSVGAVKLSTQREGPHYANVIGSNEMWLNGDIFPSGHTANAVVTWGILAYLATSPGARRGLSVIAAVFSLTIGATTVYLGTHWVSDVLLGWVAGLLVLLALPWCEPAIARFESGMLTLRDRLRGVPRADALPPLEIAARQLPQGEPEPAVVGGGGGRLSQVRLRQNGNGRPHQGVPEHPVRPVGSR